MAGVVTKSIADTVGGVFDEGTPVMQIIPSGDQLELEAFFSNRDVGFLEAGQRANIKLEAYPFERFGYIPGHVKNISADAIEIQPNIWGFVVRIVPDNPYLTDRGRRHRLQPGMTASVDVVTGERKLISYFFAPIVKTVSESLGEY